MINEDLNILKQYYYDAYGRIRNDVGSDCLLTISPLLWQQSRAECFFAIPIFESQMLGMAAGRPS